MEHIKQNIRFEIASFLQIFAAALIGVVAAYYVIWGSSALPGVDAYYHIQMAQIMKDQGLVLKSFPWTTCSVWSTAFFDKDWFFHVITIPFLFFSRILGAKIGICVLVLFIILSWGYLLKVAGVRDLFFFLFFMLFCSGYEFFGRLLLYRGHLLSILFLGLGLICLIKGKRLLLIIVTILYSLSYTGCWQLLPIAALFDGIKLFRGEERFGLKNCLFPWILIGLLLGMAINPYFPANLEGAIIQNYFVIKTSLFGVGAGTIINLGAELYHPTLKQIFTVYFPISLTLIFTVIMHVRNSKKSKMDTLVIFFGILSFVYLILTMCIMKFTDYFIPLSSVFIALSWHNKTIFWKRHVTYLLIFILVLAFGLYGLKRLRGDVYRTNYLYAGATKWLSEHARSNNYSPKEIVFTAGWDDTPTLFFGAPQYRYLVMLDPSFMYNYSADIYKLWCRISEGKVAYPEVVIYTKFNSKIVFISKFKKRLIQLLDKSPYAILQYLGPDGERIYTIHIPAADLKMFETIDKIFFKKQENNNCRIFIRRYI